MNVVMSIVDEDEKLKPICLSGSIIAKNSTAEEQVKAIIAQFRESGRLLQQWREATEELYPGRDDLLDLIP